MTYSQRIAYDSSLNSKAYFTLFVLVLLGTVAFLDRQILSLLVEPIKIAHGVGDTQIGVLQGLAFTLFYAGFALPFGYAVDKYSRRLVIFLGVLIWGVAASACGLVVTFGGLIVARAIVGLGESALAPASHSIIADSFPRHRLAFVMSLYSVSWTIGGALALVVGTQLLHALRDGIDLPIWGHLPDWRAVLFVTGLPAIALCGAIFLIKEPPRGTMTASAGSWAGLREFLGKHPRFFASHFAGFTMMMALAYANLSWLPAVLQRSFDLPVRDIGWILGTMSAVFGIIGLLGNGFLVDRSFGTGRKDAHFRYYLIAAPVAGVSAIGGALSADLPIFLCFVAPTIMIANFAGVAAAAAQLITPPQLRGKISALYQTVASLIGIILGPWAVGFISDNFVGPDQVRSAWAIATVAFSILAAFFFFIGLKPMRASVSLEAETQI